jgi:hypothetical protein
VSSVTWMREGSCLAVGTSEGEVQVPGAFAPGVLCAVTR